MRVVTFFWSLGLLASILGSPLPEKVQENPSISTDTPIENSKPTEPKSRQLLIAYLDPNSLSAPLRTREEIEEPEEDLNSHVEVFREDGEIMQPAENIIFRPLFSYKVDQAKKMNRSNQRRISNARAERTTKKPKVEQNTIKRRSDIYSYRPEELPYDPYRPYYFYNGRFYPYY